ncbi:MAG: DUF2800 domain-containing protein [Proteobacteria bacterium]|nr:DUF2800 domain-containing protein [Pseudomonadota bacterium]
MGHESHARHSPSKLPRVIDCPASVDANESLPSQESVYAEEGTMLHKVTEECVELGEAKVSQETIERWKLDDAQVEAVQVCLDYIAELTFEHGDEYSYFVTEKKVSLRNLAEPLKCEELKDVEGTSDLDYMFPSIKTLYVIDWKFGVGVEAYPDSEQLMAYAVGVLLGLGRKKSLYEKIILVIVQPRLYSSDIIKVYETDKKELLDWVTNILCPALIATTLKNPPFNPTDRACMWCKIKLTCQARKKQKDYAATKAFEIYASLPEVDMKELVAFLNVSKDLIQYIKDIEMFVYNQLTAGKEVPGYKLVAGRSIRAWKDPVKAEKFLLAKLKEDAYVRKVLSPAASEKVMKKKKMADEDFYSLIVKPEGKPTLVPTSDKRPPIEFKTVEEKFACYAEMDN